MILTLKFFKMDQNLVNQYEQQLHELKEELADIDILKKYYSKVPEEMESDIRKMIRIKERILEILKIMDNIKVL